jgi:hypothetical protein
MVLVCLDDGGNIFSLLQGGSDFLMDHAFHLVLNPDMVKYT